MIGDPLFAQRLLRLLQLRGQGPEQDIDILGLVVAIDAGLLLERAGQLPDLLFGRGFNGTKAAVVGEFGAVSLETGGSVMFIPHLVEVLYLRVVPTVASILRLYHRTPRTTGAGNLLNIQTGATHPEISQDGINHGNTDPEAVVFGTVMQRIAIPANTAYEFNSLQRGLPLISRRMTPGTTEGLDLRCWADATNVAITVTQSFIARITPIIL